MIYICTLLNLDSISAAYLSLMLNQKSDNPRKSTECFSC